MSRKSNDWAWKQTLKPTMKLTLLALADRTNEDHECFPSYQRLVNDTNLNVKTIQKNIGLLCEIGLIEDTQKRVGKTGQVKVYRFTFKDTQKRESLEISKGKPPKSGCLKHTKNGCSKDTQNRVTEPPSIEPPIEPPNKKQTKKIDLEFGFEEWWKIYPKDAGKKTALKVWAKNKLHLQAQSLIDTLTEQVKREYQFKEKQFIKNGSTYLNGEHWLDEIIDFKPDKNNPPPISEKDFGDGTPTGDLSWMQ